jgi:hypothetical protein
MDRSSLRVTARAAAARGALSPSARCPALRLHSASPALLAARRGAAQRLLPPSPARGRARQRGRRPRAARPAQAPAAQRCAGARTPSGAAWRRCWPRRSDSHATGLADGLRAPNAGSRAAWRAQPSARSLASRRCDAPRQRHAQSQPAAARRATRLWWSKPSCARAARCRQAAAGALQQPSATHPAGPAARVTARPRRGKRVAREAPTRLARRQTRRRGHSRARAADEIGRPCPSLVGVWHVRASRRAPQPPRGVFSGGTWSHGPH